MKLLKVSAYNFKNCADNVTIDFIARSKKTSEDKLYELQKIDEDLYVYNTMAFVGKNASGKTTALELLDCCYSILGDFRLENKEYSYDNVKLDIVFYHESYIYRYVTDLAEDTSLGNKAVFRNQKLYKKRYYKSYVKEIYSENDFVEVGNLGDLPEDTSSVFFILKKRTTRALYFDCNGSGVDTFQLLFKAMKNYKISDKILKNILSIFDDKILDLKMLDDANYKLILKHGEKTVSDKELIHFLSSGTTKGILLYIMAVASLEMGFDLIVDEIENHFHKTLGENLIGLYKDMAVNKHKASLVFSTHYCELLDLFGRQDNIWICKATPMIEFSNLYSEYGVRPELLKSKQFYCNIFDTAVNYNELMKFKRSLM